MYNDLLTWTVRAENFLFGIIHPEDSKQIEEQSGLGLFGLHLLLLTVCVFWFWHQHAL